MSLKSGALSKNAQTVPKMPPIMTISIKNLRLRTFIGFNLEEQEKRQDIVINIDIDYLSNPDIANDLVSGALNYKIIVKQVIHLVETDRFLLLEKMVNDVLGICVAHDSVVRVKVQIDKPHALRFADSVSLSSEYRS